MPGKVKVKILAGRNLPVMDRSGDTTDAYVELKFGNVTYKTDVCRKSLNPQWNSEWYKFEVDDAELQDEPLQIRLMDYDTYSANDAIGKVYVNLNPLLLHGILPPVKNLWTLETTINTSTGSQASVMTGWIPVYDTMHGIRGEVNIIIKVELFSDFNRFRQSSCGVQFFYSPNIPYGYHAQMIHGFVEELVVSDDPEYKWIDKIRTPRASNEARQTLFFKLSGEVQRKIGLKALDLGGNAVIGYLQNFDLEGESGIVARGIGTVVTLVKLHDVGFPCDNANIEEITFVSSQTKTQIEHVDSGDNASFIPVLVPIRVPASYPMRVPLSRNRPFYLRTSSSLTRLEPTTKMSRISEYPRTRKHNKQISFFRSKSSNLSFNTSTDLVLSKFSTDETEKSLRGMSKDIRTQSSRDRVAKQIKYLRSKFNCAEDNNCSTKPDDDSDFNSIRSFTINTRNFKKNKDFKDTSSIQGKIMTTLLIGSIQNMFLDDVMNVNRISVNCSSEQTNDEINRHKKNIENYDKNQEKLQQNGSSIVDDKQILSFNNDNSTDHGLLDDSAKYNTLNNSRYSLDKDSGSTCSKTESQTESTLQFDLNVTSQSSSDTSSTSTSDVEIEKNDLHKIIYSQSDISIDTSELSIDGNQRNDLLSDNSSFVISPENDSFNLKSIHSSVNSKQRTDYARITPCRLSRMHRVHLSRHERDLCRIRSQTPLADFRSLLFETNNKIHLKTGKQKDNPKKNSTLDSSNMTTYSIKEIYAIVNAERQKRMRELINLIDMKMMVPAFTTCCDRKIISSTLKCKKHRNMRNISNSRNSLEKSSFRDTVAIKTDTSQKCQGKDTCSKHLSLIQHPSISSNAISHSCNCSLSSLTDNHTYVSSSNRKRTIIRFPATDDQSVDVSKLSLKKSLPNSHSEPDTIISNDIHELVKTNNLTSLSSDTAKTTIFRRNSTSSLKVFYHIDCAKPTNSANMTYNWCVSHPSPDLRQQDEASLSPSYPLPTVPTVAAKTSQSPAAKGLATVPVHRRSSDSDLSVTPKGNSLGGSDRSTTGVLKTSAAAVRPMNQDTLEMLEYPFITMQHYPPSFILRIGGLVSSRSVKLLERISNLEEPESRDAWWIEIRMEVRSHARALACNVVIGYKEETSICDDVCVLSASGTAAVISFHNSTPDPDSIVLNKFQQSMPVSVDLDRDKNQQKLTKIDGDITNLTRSETRTERQSGKTPRHYSESNDHEESCNQFQLRCNLCHLPYSENNVPFRINVSKCAICKRANVPDVIFTTIEVPANIPINGRGCFIHAIVCKNKKDLRGELNAKEISDCLPFLEYELHSLLLNKLKVKGMNAIFGLKLQVSVGERLIIAMAVGTALYLTALPPPTIPKIASGNSWHKENQLADIQKSIVETVKKNREFYRLKSTGISEVENGRTQSTSDTDDSDDDLPELDLGSGIRDTCILEVDDIEDMDRVSLLIMDDRPPDDFHVVNTQAIPGLEDLEIVRNLQMFTQISRTKIPIGQFSSMPSKYFTRLLQSLYFKLRRMVPCALCDMQFKIALAEQDEIQLSVVGMALGLGEPLKLEKLKKKVVSHSLSKDQLKKSDDSELIFSLDEDHVENNVTSDNTNRTCSGNPTSLSNIQNLVQKPRQRSPLRSRTFVNNRHKHVPLKGRYGVDITPLSYLPGGKIERYQGNLNFFFIRESTSIRENGGLSGFTHSFVMEVLAIVRAHITALGGNAMVAFFMTQCVLFHNPHKNQGQCLINVGGDVVTVSYYANEKHNVSNC